VVGNKLDKVIHYIPRLCKIALYRAIDQNAQFMSQLQLKCPWTEFHQTRMWGSLDIVVIQIVSIFPEFSLVSALRPSEDGRVNFRSKMYVLSPPFYLGEGHFH